jgi:hypothetical protein
MHARLITVCLACVAILLAACSSSGSGSATKSSAPPAAATTSAAAKTSPAAPKPTGPEADVTVGALTLESTLNFPQVPVTITNHSSKRSNYIVDLTIESADGKTQIDSTIVAANNLEPGQTAKETGHFFKPGPLPAGAKVVVKKVTRYASA